MLLFVEFNNWGENITPWESGLNETEPDFDLEGDLNLFCNQIDIYVGF